MKLEGMANTISGGIDYMCYESECSDEVEEVKAAEDVMYELVSTLKEHGIETVNELKDMFSKMEIFTKHVDNMMEVLLDARN